MAREEMRSQQEEQRPKFDRAGTFTHFNIFLSNQFKGEDKKQVIQRSEKTEQTGFSRSNFRSKEETKTDATEASKPRFQNAKKEVEKKNPFGDAKPAEPTPAQPTQPTTTDGWRTTTPVTKKTETTTTTTTGTTGGFRSSGGPPKFTRGAGNTDKPSEKPAPSAGGWRKN